MSNPHENFENIVAGSDNLKLRWETISAQVIKEAAGHGVTLSREDVLDVSSARIATLSGQPMDDISDELFNHRAFVKRRENLALKQAVEEGREDAIASLPTDPARRITRSRELGIDTVRETPKAENAADREVLVRRLMTLRPALRIAKAREWNLV